jgi:predicted regulator of Ras-like GTPase activity (Roadblock/LC7/MglB family)
MASESEGSGPMINVSTISKFPEVRSAIVADLRGALLESAGEPDAEGIAAIVGFVTSAMAQAGDLLGIGGLQRIVVSGPGSASILTINGDTIVVAFVDPSKPVAAIEKKLDAVLLR